jgi:hypothetical protein
MTSLRLLLGLSASLLAGHAWAQASVVTQATINVVEPAQISQGADLSMADVTRPSAGSRVAIAQAGSYTVTGMGGETFNLSTPTTLTLVRVGGTEEVQLTLTPSRVQGAHTGPVDHISATQIGLSGSVPVSSTTAVGTYQGKYTVTLAYQ